MVAMSEVFGVSPTAIAAFLLNFLHGSCYCDHNLKPWELMG